MIQDRMDTVTMENMINGGADSIPRSMDIYPLSSYYFGSKDPIPFKDESFSDHTLRMKSNYAANGLRTSVEAVIMEFIPASHVSSSLFQTAVELFKHPHLLVLQVRNTHYKLPGGRLRRGESELECLQRKLSQKLSFNEAGDEPEWQIEECLGMWWRPDFETLMYPYLPPNVNHPKECIKLFLVKLPVSRKFIVPSNFKLLAVPLHQIHENTETYGSIISGVPQLLSKYSFNMIRL